MQTIVTVSKAIKSFNIRWGARLAAFVLVTSVVVFPAVLVSTVVFELLRFVAQSVAARIEPTGEPFSPRFKKILNWTATVVAFFQAAWAGMHFFYLRLDQRALHWAEGVVWTDHPMWFTPEWLSSAVLLFVSAACLSTPLLAIGSGGGGVGATRPAASLAAPDR